MPSRRRSRRSPQLIRYNSLSRRDMKMIKRPQKHRLIRRYIREKKVDPKANGKQLGFSGLHATAASSRPVRNPGKPFGGPHDVVPVRKNPIKQPAEINTIPNPIPDTGSITFGSIAPGSPLLGAIRDTSTFGLVIPPTPPSLPLSITPPGPFSALPPLQSPIKSVTSAILIDTDLRLSSTSFAGETNLPKSPNVNPQTTASKTHSVNLAVIILLAVGSTLLLLGSCILIKICTRTRRKSLPKPSLPIFEDADPEADFFESKESPIFGGNERLSPMPDSHGADGPAWTWNQYPHARTVASAQRNSSGGPHTGSHSIQLDLGHIPADTPSESPPLFPATSLHTLRRQSMGAASIYSPRSCADIAQAITHDRLTTANGGEISTQSRRTKSRSQLVRDEKQRHRESATSTIGLAYDGDFIASPSIIEHTPVDTPVTGHREGRERIKSSYFATGSYPIVSKTHGTAYSIATATRVNVGQRTSFSKDKFTLQNSNSKWHRDTQALTYALGLATPETNYLGQSPQPTLYPEDSMSVTDIEKRNQSDRKPLESVPNIPVVIPDDKMRRNSGLMNMDFRVSQMSLSELTIEDGGWCPTGTSEPNHAKDRMPGAQSVGTRSRSSYSAGMPPRVPSPPPLPSLSQMALAQHNPEAYANYRSPTYSMYGLYESPDRKSVTR